MTSGSSMLPRLFAPGSPPRAICCAARIHRGISSGACVAVAPAPPVAPSIQWLQDDVRGAIAVWGLQGVADMARCGQRHALHRHRWAAYEATQPFELLSLTRRDVDADMQREPAGPGNAAMIALPIIHFFPDRFAMTGWRLGCAAGPEPVITQIAKLNTPMKAAPRISCRLRALKPCAIRRTQRPSWRNCRSSAMRRLLPLRMPRG
jgi:hypothetical protein